MAEIRKFLILITTILLAAALMLPVAAADPNEPYAKALNTLDLFRGTENGFELERTPTRAEALALLVRVLGKEKEALSGEFSHPFRDAGWADAYIGYAYSTGLVKGMSANEYGSSLPVTSNQYAAMLLRALGYSDDSGGQFSYGGAYSFALHKLALTDGDGSFTRGELARLTYAALDTPLYGSHKTLGQKLMSERVFTQGQLTAAKKSLQSEPVTTAVLVYAVASDLESKLGMLSMDIDEMLDAGGCVEILIQTGGTKNYHNRLLADGKTQRLSLTGGTLSVLETLEGVNMCERESLADFLTYAEQNMTADRYILVLWDHGEGTLGGFGRDELNGDASLSLADLKAALAAFDQKFDLIVFDACLMGTAECAFALTDAGRYMIASEDITPTDGLYYTSWLHALAADPTISTEALARRIVDAYIVHAPAGRGDVTMSVIRLEKARMLAERIEKLLADKPDPAALQTLTPSGMNGGCDQYDLMAVGRAVSQNPDTLRAALEETVYYRRSVDGETYAGLAIYLPLARGSEYEKVRGDLLSVGYPEAILSILDILKLEGNGG